MKKSLIETLKFVIRLIILVGIPQLILWLTKAGGDWVTVANALSILLPIADKWVHVSPLKANGLVPF